MLTSLACLFLVGILFSQLLQQLHLPGLLGMILTGILLGPYGLNWLSPQLMTIATDLRQLALVLILLRAGLALDLNDLKRVGRPAILLCFVPAFLEIIGYVVLGPGLLGLSAIECAVMGAVIAAVSPAVIVPRMLKLMEEKRGTAQSIPQMIMAGASADDVLVIVLFSSFLSLAQGESGSAVGLLQVPVSILAGLFIGAITGLLLCWFFRRVHLRDSIKVLILMSVAFLLLEAENWLQAFLPFSGLLAIMAMGIAIYSRYSLLAGRLSQKFSRLWVGAEMMLFVLVGAVVNPAYLVKAGGPLILLIFSALLLRMGAVALCLIKTSLNWKERVFCMIAYCPKATVQAAIGAVPLSLGLACGELVLSAAVIAILITAPLGALGIDLTYRRWLKPEKKSI
ncbi:cation:proton antiporter [Holdemania massiliensis]|uniref:cation:proton antiporter n=1 Tax=Holdemania massiliensis TaxID=1468449 RepID=UPI001F0541F8|nr:cation:proton antiporter [Holdemania massiliensis]MCH1942177.1 cation:proton antiporter [Holdemania massiliensis]